MDSDPSTISVEQLYFEAQDFYQMGDYTSAIINASLILAIDEDSTLALATRGRSYGKQGLWEQSLQDLSRCITLNPNNALFYYNRGITWYRKGEYWRAIFDYNMAVMLNPVETCAYYNRGIAYLKLGKYASALLDFNFVLRYRPIDSAAYINRAETYFLMGEYYLALMDLRTAESLFPNNLLVAADVALTLHAIGEVSAACSVWQGLMDEELGFCDVGWLRREFEWLDPLIDRARMILRDLM